jgi:hypothetical protein
MSFVRAEADYLAAKNNGVSLTHVHDIEDQLFPQGTAQGITFVASNADHGAIPLVRGNRRSAPDIRRATHKWSRFTLK